jgi:maltooligosyltrehalose trehalohydrolase
MLCGAAILLCSPYTPMIYMGEEWAAGTPWQFFASFPDPELAEAVRTGRREEFAEHGWDVAEVPDPLDPATVARSTLRWEELAEPAHRKVFDTYQALISLRRNHSELSDPRLDRFTVAGAGEYLVLHRGSLRVVVNLAAEPETITLDRPAGTALLASAEPTLSGREITLPAESFAIVRLA